jgi:Short C-terminal domain
MSTICKAMRRARPLRRGLSLIVLAVAVSACVSAGAKDGRDRSYVYRSADNYVRLDPIEPGAPANSHPFAVSADQLRRLLARVTVSGAASVAAVPVFSKEELDRISGPLAEALSKAAPNQDVTFAVTSPNGLFGAYSVEAVTTGRLFVRGDSVNLIFGLIQERLDGDILDQSRIPEIIPGKRLRRIDPGWKIEPGSAHFHERRGDWLVFDGSTIPGATMPATGPAPETSAKPTGEAATAPTTVESKEQQIESRLRVLDQLKEKGVITEQEYRERRHEILQEL